MVDIWKGAFVRVEVVKRPDNAVTDLAGVLEAVVEPRKALHRSILVVGAVERVQPVQVQDIAGLSFPGQPIALEGVVPEFQVNVQFFERPRQETGVGIAWVLEGQASNWFPEEKDAHGLLGVGVFQSRQ